MAKKTPVSEDTFINGFPMTLGPADKVDKVEPSQDSLLEKFARLEERFNSVQQSLDQERRTNMALMTRPTTEISQIPQKPQPKDLPDPYVDKDGYAAVLRENVLSELAYEREQERAQNRQANDQNSRTQALFAQFAAKYPDHAKNTELVEAAAVAASKAAASRGMNVETYMFANSDQYIEDVKSKIDQWAPPTTKVDDDGDDDNRTLGIPGGLESRGNVVGAGEDKAAGALFDGVRDWQQKGGWTR